MIEGRVLHFSCRTASPFHTTRQEYANLIKCAPFILGSTIRGAVLYHLITSRCSREKLAQLGAFDDPAQITSFHRGCECDCVVKWFFDDCERVWFSFGRFETQRYGAMTRIAIQREVHSVAEGSIVNVEVVEPGSGFSFDCFLFDDAQEIATDVSAAVEGVGRWHGLGRLRSLGLGRFALLEVQGEPLEDRFERELSELSLLEKRVQIEFTTPFVFGAEEGTEMGTGEALGQVLATEIAATASRLAGEGKVEPMRIVDVEARFQPEFVGRFSYERKLRENRLVAWPESTITFTIEDPPGDLHEQLTAARLLGIGEWKQWGYGRFDVQAV